MWRSGWDSNPRAGFWPTKRFRVVLVMTASIPLHVKLCVPDLRNSPEIGEKTSWGENEERKPESFLRHDASEALKNQDIFGRGFQNGHTFSSAAPSTTRTTLLIPYHYIRWPAKNQEGLFLDEHI